MAKKIFRLHTDGITEETGWFKSGIITSENLKTIKTEGKEVATSIPTPFATIDLVKSAFQWVAENKIKGNSAHHKLVSDALDVAQLFYSYPRFKNKIRVIAWNPKDRLKKLSEFGNPGHKKFADTLQLYWDQDSVSEAKKEDKILYNFEKIKRFYLILNKETNKVIGGTSPSTLFFASPDVKLAAANLDIKIGHDQLFDDEYAPLFERESTFIEYFYTFSKQKNFSTYFPELFEYLEKNRNHLNTELNQSITDIEQEDMQSYPSCLVLDNENDICEVLGIKLGVQKDNLSRISSDSDFIIKSDFTPNGIKPMVLPQYPFSKKWTYTTQGILWSENTKTAYRNTEDQEHSRLPEQLDLYYWLTEGNFLADKIVQLPYPMDSSKFVTCGSNRFLLPLSDTFFKYFKPEIVSQHLKIKERAGGNVDVELKIPVKAGEIIFKKQYSFADRNIETLNFHLAIFPFITSNEFELNYNIGVLDNRVNKPFAINLNYFTDGKQIQVKSPITRNPGKGGEVLSKYYSMNNRPDVVEIIADSATGFIVPILNVVNGTAKVNFAIDFGTTNTHIEYQIGGNNAKPFDNLPIYPLWQSLLDRKTNTDDIYVQNENTFEQEVLPFTFSKSVNLTFPLRTALVHNKDVDFNNKVEIIREVNNYFLLEKRGVPKHLELKTELKWSNYADILDERKVESYLEFLMTITFYKTLQSGGDPKSTTITWFYPVSMDDGELEVFFKLWKTVYKKVFKENSESGIKGIPESIAPYLYYKSTVEGLSLSIDVGGGSTDIAVFDEDDNMPKLISSFKFAGNSIFGDGYPSNEFQNNSDRNGFVKSFKNDAKNAVKNDEQKKILLENILNERKNSSDFNSYLFSLEQDDLSGFSYTRLLIKNKKVKLSILVFYSAIAYYSAKLLKKAAIKIPKYILLSGTASKSASIVDTSENLNNLSKMYQFIFEKVHGSNVNENIKVFLSDIPKEVTCKGALKGSIEGNIKESPVKFWIGGSQNSWGHLLDRENNTKITPKYGDLTNELEDEIENSIKEFYTFLDDYVETVNLESKYLIDNEAYKVFREMRNSGIKDFLKRGIKSFYKKDETKIEETLFFYPLIGILNRLSYELAKNENE